MILYNVKTQYQWAISGVLLWSLHGCSGDEKQWSLGKGDDLHSLPSNQWHKTALLYNSYMSCSVQDWVNPRSNLLSDELIGFVYFLLHCTSSFTHQRTPPLPPSSSIHQKENQEKSTRWHVFPPRQRTGTTWGKGTARTETTVDPRTGTYQEWINQHHLLVLGWYGSSQVGCL